MSSWQGPRLTAFLVAAAMLALPLFAVGAQHKGTRLAKKDKHYGHKANTMVNGTWEACENSASGTPQPIDLNADYDAGTSSITFVKATAAQVAGVFLAAHAGCFIDDTEPDDDPPSNKTSEFEDGESMTATIRVRPIANINTVSKGLLDKTTNKGFFVADYLVKSVGNLKKFRAKSTLRTIGVDHSVLLWLGTDSKGSLYTAVIDLGNFPAVLSSNNPSDLRVVKTGKWEQPDSTRKKHAVPFARFKDPVGHAVKDDRKYHPRNHEGSWLSCDAGCCLATGFSIL